ncbi:protein DOG1-like 3 [Sesamum angolense]|uniref:Protein DOG1-like 3 n=1 Tax=Sesamum angolense TaxID=2727404 RepID=A0AAE2BJ17_9LAMI|nr:protein DOG1-like 3 [Sesamum angolense]
MATFNRENIQSFSAEWIAQQHQDLKELLDELSTNSESDNEKLKLLSDKSFKRFEEYHERRALLAKQDAPLLLSPAWCAPFENAFFWIGGSRPSLYVRIIYLVCGSEVDGSQLAELFQNKRKGSLLEISAQQIDMIDTLHCKTIREEQKMSARMESLQEEIADEPLAVMDQQVGDSSLQDLDRTMDTHYLSLASILTDADQLRLSTLKELIGLLTPLQAVELLFAIKKLYLSMHEWGKRDDHQPSKIEYHNDELRLVS